MSCATATCVTSYLMSEPQKKFLTVNRFLELILASITMGRRLYNQLNP